MPDSLVPRLGAVLSADIAVPEHAAEVRFYSQVLGTGEAPLWRDDLANNLGVPIIGLGERGPDYADLPLQWMPHIMVADVAVSAQRTLELGGDELMHARGEDGSSQWAVLVDPQGAAFGVIPVPASAASPEAGRQGRICGLLLEVEDVPAARAFYEAVVGDVPAASIGQAHGTAVPPVWLIQLPVDDLVASLAVVRDRGGTILRQTRGQGGEPVSAVVRDPVGACFGLVQG